MRRICKRNGNRSQTLKPIIKERASYCIQFEIGTETVKILKFNKFCQASAQIIIDLSEWRELESKSIRDFRKELAMSNSPSRKKYGFSYDSKLKNFDEFVDLGYGNSFYLLTSEHLTQRIIFEKWLEFDIFYRNLKKCFSPLRIHLHDWQKLKQFVIQGTRKKKRKFNRITQLFRRKHGVEQEDESDNKLENQLNFCLFKNFFKFPICW